MLAQYPYFRGYILTALETGPGLFDELLEGITDEEADFRPDPDRFTIREVMAHMAEWEPIFRERMGRIKTEDDPDLPGYNEAQLAIDHDYAHTNLAEQCALLRSGRQQTISFLKGLDDADWDRPGLRGEIGKITLEAIALLMPLHDLYHLRQVSEWRKMFAAR